MNEKIITNVEGFTLRYAKKEDANTILDFIKGIAIYEDMLDDVTATKETLEENIFEKEYCKVLLAEYEGNVVGYCLFFYTFSTFMGKPTLYIEDIFFNKEVRGKGFGSEVFKVMATIAKEKDCARMEWCCLDWNEPSIQFYKSKGAVPMSEWTTFRLTEKEISDLAFDTKLL